MNIDKKRLSKELKEAHPDVTLLASLVTIGDTPLGDGRGATWPLDGGLKAQDSKEMKKFLMAKKILPLTFELQRLKPTAPAAGTPATAAASAATAAPAPQAFKAKGKDGKDIPFAPQGTNRWVGRIL